uniref:Uncharacterized protein n=1 Tax=Anguilla anguilla TaxID=7936 RepID=A0A0E9TYZ4_ANGAN
MFILIICTHDGDVDYTKRQLANSQINRTIHKRIYTCSRL